MNAALYGRLIEIAFDLQCGGDELDTEAARWILARTKDEWARSRARKPRMVRVRVQDAKGGTFWIKAESLKEKAEDGRLD